MSKFLSQKFKGMKPYVPGEQPRDKTYIKLNTNESPFPPSPKAQAYAKVAAENLQLYADPTCKALTEKMADLLGVNFDEVVLTNGSDETLNFVFMAFGDETHPIAYPDISYGFYSVYANLYGIPSMVIPLREDFSICADDYIGLNCTIVIANPNAPTGLVLPLSEVERIVRGNPDNVVVIDEAYVDFGNESAVKLLPKYNNLLVVQTFSKSRSMAGGRLGFAVGNRELIADLNNLRFSTNPFNVNAMTMAAGIGSLEDKTYFEDNCRAIMENRAWLTQQLRSMGFEVLDSHTNFVFAKHAAIGGKELYLKLKDKGILVRHFDAPRLDPFIRITIGDKTQMQAVSDAVKQILEEVQ